jgi:hypothetical protein
MFHRRYHRTRAGKTHTHYALVGSVRTEAGPRLRVIAHLGELNHDEARRRQRTVVFHNRQGDGRQLRPGCGLESNAGRARLASRSLRSTLRGVPAPHRQNFIAGRFEWTTFRPTCSVFRIECGSSRSVGRGARSSHGVGFFLDMVRAE